MARTRGLKRGVSMKAESQIQNTEWRIFFSFPIVMVRLYLILQKLLRAKSFYTQ